MHTTLFCFDYPGYILQITHFISTLLFVKLGTYIPMLVMETCVLELVKFIFVWELIVISLLSRFGPWTLL